MNIELIYDADCPNIGPARAQIEAACRQAGVPASWQEWERADSAAPAYVRSYGSPTILINGKDVAGGNAVDGSSCRLYRNHDGSVSGVPALARIIQAIAASRPVNTAPSQKMLRLNAAVFGSAGFALLPKLACPACWPAYAGLLGAVGLGFLIQASWLLTLTSAFLLVALVALAYHAAGRRGYGPFVLGLGATPLVLLGKFRFDSDLTMYAGLTILVCASLWNTWPRPEQGPSCPHCADDSDLTTIGPKRSGLG